MLEDLQEILDPTWSNPGQPAQHPGLSAVDLQQITKILHEILDPHQILQDFLDPPAGGPGI